MKPLDTGQLAAELGALPAWTHDRTRNALHRRIELEDFARTFGLMTQIAIIADKRDHHPEWSNVYNRLEIWLTTHDAAGVSQRDVDMAREIDRLLPGDF
ncbi:MAG: 4a-hydroxytetrahydrobiopterin dehydratase [Sphingopyxis sp.]|nr:4a-hydroxytetrahydrobiopterin dehydratase [Sphingopyxis sp.]